MPVKTPVKPPVEPEKMMRPKESAASAMIDKIPIALVLSLASPYLAGQKPEEAIELAHKIRSQSGYTSTLDILGEDMDSDLTCDASVEQYKKLADAICANPINVEIVEDNHEQLTISLKPSMFSTKAPGEAGAEAELAKAASRIEAVTAYAQEKGLNVTLEAEDHRWTDFHLDTYFNLIEKGLTNLGTVIQTRLFRTEQDLARFDARTRVRLVIGIYNEPEKIALTDKVEMKKLLVRYAGMLLDQGVYVEIATHDQSCIESFMQDVILPKGIEKNRFEFQFLHGVPRDDLQKKLHDHGMLVRKYLPFGKANVAGAYCRRRLKENPNMISYGIKNLFRLQ